MIKNLNIVLSYQLGPLISCEPGMYLTPLRLGGIAFQGIREAPHSNRWGKGINRRTSKKEVNSLTHRFISGYLRFDSVIWLKTCRDMRRRCTLSHTNMSIRFGFVLEIVSIVLFQLSWGSIPMIIKIKICETDLQFTFLFLCLSVLKILTKFNSRKTSSQFPEIKWPRKSLLIVEWLQIIWSKQNRIH